MTDFGPSRSHARRGHCITAALCFTGMALLLNNCGEVSFKRGGGLDGLEASQHSCHAQHTDNAGYVQCMEAAGWYTADLGGDPAKSTPPASSAVTGETTAVVAHTPSAALMGALAPAETVSAPQADSPPPSAIVAVNSWWKFGGNEGALSADLTACGSLSGDRNHVTRAALLCMRDKGWYGVGTK